jgi:hypothetical protein
MLFSGRANGFFARFAQPAWRIRPHFSQFTAVTRGCCVGCRRERPPHPFDNLLQRPAADITAQAQRQQVPQFRRHVAPARGEGDEMRRKKIKERRI